MLFLSAAFFLLSLLTEPRFRNTKKDNNIFFTALTDFTLRQPSFQLPAADKEVYDNIHARASFAYAFFQNKKGRNTYNFWRTDTAYLFPYTWWIGKLKKNTALPDDMDDTVLSLLAQRTDSAAAAAAHNLMQLYTLADEKKGKPIDKKYRRFGAYSVWYGRQFPVVFDVCVLSNVLYFVQQYNLAWTAADSASLRTIVSAVGNQDILNRPLNISPYYGNTAIILYHLARLMSVKPIAQLEAKKEQLRSTALAPFYGSKNPLEKAILCTAIMRWGYAAPGFAVATLAEMEQNDLPFFIGNIPSYFPEPFRAFFLRKRLGLFYHYCPAYNNALWLEYLSLKQSFSRR